MSLCNKELGLLNLPNHSCRERPCSDTIQTEPLKFTVIVNTKLVSTLQYEAFRECLVHLLCAQPLLSFLTVGTQSLK